MLDAFAIDFGLGHGAQVSAVAAGNVTWVPGENLGYGNLMWIDHGNGFVSFYAHLLQSQVPNGPVQANQVIALADNTGAGSDGDHLHFSLRSGATSWNDGTAYKPEPMSGWTGFGAYGRPACGSPSPTYRSRPDNSSTRNALWRLRNSNTSGPPDLSPTFGLYGDVAVVGDWCGLGKKDIGVYRGGTWFLRCTNVFGDVINSFTFTPPDASPYDIPVAGGDWTGKGFDTVGVVRPGQTPGTLEWRQKDAHDASAWDRIFPFGDPGDWPVVGNWSGRTTLFGPITTVGVVRPGSLAGTSTWYLRYDNSFGVTDLSFPYGDPWDTPVVGNWTGSAPCLPGPGVARPGVGPNNLYWYLRNSLSQGPPNIGFNYENPSDAPVTGDWTGQVSASNCFIDTVGVSR